MSTAVTKGLWAPICAPERGTPWVFWVYVRSTRRESKAAYLEGCLPEAHKDALKRVRFARVTIIEEMKDAA